ncbi:hypothetical protein PAXINDRAFT_77896, partial [Paxillus involutus ATCC 200175]
VRATIRRFLAGCNTQYKVVPFDHTFYQECLDIAVQRGYPVSSTKPFPVLTYLCLGALYGTTSGAHNGIYGKTTRCVATSEDDTRRAFRIWIALYTGYATFADDIPRRCPQEMPSLHAFHDRFVKGEKQEITELDALADLMREVPRVFGGTVPANIAMTSTLDFITATIIEAETKDMQVSPTAKRYASYHRLMSAVGKAYAIMVFSPEIPFEEYIQAMLEIALFIANVNDVLSFYKEELAGESTNRVGTIAARKGISRVEAFEELADTSVELYETILSILEDSPRACEAFKQFTVGYAAFHTTFERYQLVEVGL